MELQEALKTKLGEAYIPSTVFYDENFGPYTYKGLRAWEKDNADLPGITQDGKIEVGSEEWDSLMAQKSLPSEVASSVSIPQLCQDVAENSQTVLCVEKGTPGKLLFIKNGVVLADMKAGFGDEEDNPTREVIAQVYKAGGVGYENSWGVDMPFPMFFNGGQAVHYSEKFEGYIEDGGAKDYRSLGCVTVGNLPQYAAIARQFEIADPNSMVVVLSVKG